MERRVLVLDDDASLRLLCRVNLELAGCTVLEAATVAEADDIMRRERVDVALLDAHVGGASGLELVETLRAWHPGVRVFLLTGDTRVTEQHRARVDGVLRKPFELEELDEAVR